MLIMAAACLVFMAGCDGEYGKDKTCDPGETRPCECPGGATSEETCDDDGDGWGICQCGEDTSTDTYPDLDSDADPDDLVTDPEIDTPPEVDATDVAEDETEPAWHYECRPIGSGYSDGFFTLVSFKGKLYAGQFGYGHESQSMLYSYPPWELVSPGLTGISESICAMQELDGQLFANTESSGDIFRSSDGSNWEREYDGENGSIGCGLAVFNGDIYGINYRNSQDDHGRIMRRDGGAWTTVYDSGSESMYIREIVAYDGKLYGFAVLVGPNQGRMLVSSDGATWDVQSVPNRYFRGHVWNGYLWVGSTNFTSTGEVAVWRFDGSEFVKMHDGTRRYISDLQDHHGRLFAATSNGWKEESGPSDLLMSPDGESDWRQICEFSETAVWNMAVLGDTLYLGTWHFGVGGSVYEVVQVEDPDEPVDCSPIAANPAWEVCEEGFNLCAGVYSDGAGCTAYCAAAGLVCFARYGGEPDCIKEPENVLSCSEVNDHLSDWCECRRSSGPGPGDCTPAPGILGVGDTFTQEVDAHTGDEHTTQPKTDANDGAGGDNPDFRRHNVARAHNDYWYTSSYREADEPDPNGEQWVDYTPDFTLLGVGCYHIVAQYRATESRATYAAYYQIRNEDGLVVQFDRVQERGSGEYRDEDLGNQYMCPDSYVRIEDPGANSITFNIMRFTYLGDSCP